MTPIGEKIREARSRMGITQGDLAAAVGVHQSVISRIERGEQDLPSRKMHLLLERLGVDPADMTTPVPDHEFIESLESAWVEYEKSRAAYEALMTAAESMSSFIRSRLRLESIEISDRTKSQPWDQAVIEAFSKRSPPPAKRLAAYRRFHINTVPDPRRLNAVKELLGSVARIDFEGLEALCILAAKLAKSAESQL